MHRVLVVDDDPLVTVGISTLVVARRMRGVELVCDTATDEASAYAMLACKPCCAIVDASLTRDPADRGGIRVVREISVSRRPCGVCGGCYDWSCFGGCCAGRAFRERRFSGFFKPFDPGRLLDVVMNSPAHWRGRRTQSGERLVVSPIAIDGNDLTSKLRQEEKTAVARALAKANGNVTQAGELLGQNRQWVQRAKKRFDIK